MRTGGPTYNWVDISSIGTPLGFADDDYSDEIEMGFEFDFYDNTFSTVRVMSNGFLSFTSTSTDYSNDPIPTSSEPNNLVAVCWDDLSPNLGGEVYYYVDANRFIAQWDSIPHYSSGEVFTFQAILKQRQQHSLPVSGHRSGQQRPRWVSRIPRVRTACRSSTILAAT